MGNNLKPNPILTGPKIAPATPTVKPSYVPPAVSARGPIRDISGQATAGVTAPVVAAPVNNSVDVAKNTQRIADETLALNFKNNPQATADYLGMDLISKATGAAGRLNTSKADADAKIAADKEAKLKNDVAVKAANAEIDQANLFKNQQALMNKRVNDLGRVRRRLPGYQAPTLGGDMTGARKTLLGQ